MNVATVAAVTIAAVAVLGVTGGMIALTYRVGRLVGRVETLIDAGSARYVRLERDIGSANASLNEHLTWHSESRRRR